MGAGDMGSGEEPCGEEPCGDESCFVSASSGSIGELFRPVDVLEKFLMSRTRA